MAGTESRRDSRRNNSRADDLVEQLKELIEFIASKLVALPEEVEVREMDSEWTTVLELRVHPEDLGKIIGRQGRTAQAIRTLMNVTAAKSRKKIVLEIIE